MHARISAATAVAALAGVALLALGLGAPVADAVETTPVDPFPTLQKDVTEGSLRVVKEDGSVVACPLKHTDVEADVSGFIARVKVTQTFHNPMPEPIEAVYVFPLPHNAAVDSMVMDVGDRKIVGVIKRRDQARAIYEAALARGATAALLEQERPNIFTQSVGNIDPDQEIKIEISYVDVLEYDMGVYAFHFPMVVGPRFIPGTPTSKDPETPPELEGKVADPPAPEGGEEPKGTGWSSDTDRVEDASRITPPVLKPGMRNGHDISLSVKVDAGVPIHEVEFSNHEVASSRSGESRLTASIKPADSIPNKDFVMKYKVVGEKPAMALLPHTDQAGQGYFMLMVQPSEDPRISAKQPPREISFLIDVSGSMSGRPTAKVKEAMRGMLEKVRPDKDTLQVVTFAGSANSLFDKPVPATDKNVDKALTFTEGIRGGGGTRMLKGIKKVISDPLDEKRVRIVVMLTDGYIGNEAEIIAEVGRECGDRIRFWCIGVGSSVNRHLIDGVAKQGGGMAKVLGLGDDASTLATEIMYRIQRAQLADVKIGWGGLDVYETYPTRIPELWAGRPIVLFGMYAGGGSGVITVSGSAEGEPVSWPLRVTLPAREPDHDVLAKVWARRKIKHLMHTTYYQGSPEVEEAVTAIALEYGLMSQYTSFVAVDERELDEIDQGARPPRRMLVPVPMPEGVSYEGVFGEELRFAEADKARAVDAPAAGGWGYGGGGPAPSAAPPTRRPMARARTGAAAPPEPATLFRNAGAVQHAQRRATVDLGDLREASFVDEAGVKRPGDRAAYNFRHLEVDAKALRAAAAQAFEKAETLRKDGKLLEARRTLQRAYLLLRIPGVAGGEKVPSPGEVAKTLSEVNAELHEAWAKDLPALETKLDLVIRDMSLEKALGRIAEAAGLKVHLVPGSEADAARLTGVDDEIRVVWLDLRGATAREALDWLLTPERIAWRVEDGKRVVASTVRRLDATTTWAYPVAEIAAPTKEELADAKDWGARNKLLKEKAETLVTALREELGAEESEATWYDGGHILVTGNRDRHQQVADLLEALADPKAEVDEDLADLHDVTAKRAETYRTAVKERLPALRRQRALASMSYHVWQVLASAAAGELDLEALTRLQVASRKVDGIDEIRQAQVAAMTAWALGEAAEALPAEKELGDLAASLRKRFEKPVAEALEKQADPITGLFAARVWPEMEAAEKAVAAGKQEGFVALAELLRTGELEPDRVPALIEQARSHPGLVVLAAVGCRRAGGETWQRFRAEAEAMLGQARLPGAVSVLISRLPRSKLKL